MIQSNLNEVFMSPVELTLVLGQNSLSFLFHKYFSAYSDYSHGFEM